MRRGYLAPHKYLATNGDMWPHVLVIAAVTVLALYLAGLYDPHIWVSRGHLASQVLVGLILMLCFAGIATIAVGNVRSYIRLGSQAFIHILGVAGLGVVLWRLAWMTLGPTRRAP
jgi:hypothetical protein